MFCRYILDKYQIHFKRYFRSGCSDRIRIRPFQNTDPYLFKATYTTFIQNTDPEQQPWYSKSKIPLIQYVKKSCPILYIEYILYNQNWTRLLGHTVTFST